MDIFALVYYGLEADRMIIRALLTFLVLVATFQLATPASSRDCVHSDYITTCDGAGEIHVSGTKHFDGNAHFSKAAVLLTKQRSVQCNGQTGAILQTLGDINAGANAGYCTDLTQTCAQFTKYDPNPYGEYTPVIMERRQANGQWTFNGDNCVAPAVPAVTIEDVRQELTRLIPTAGLGLAPSGTTLVNMQTVMWVDAPRTQTLGPVAILGRSVQIWLTLDSVSYDYGDGASASADAPGKAYDKQADPCRTAMCPGYDGHVYRATGDVTVAATVQWTATFSVDGGDRITIPGTVAGPTARSAVVVKQARGVLVPDP